MSYPKVTNKRILITGGAGFIGSNLCKSLLQNNNEVICLDNFATGKPENIQEFFTNPHFKLIVGDIRNLDDCKKATEGIDYILHEAALGSVPRSINDPITTNQVNIDGFLNMLIAARDTKVKRFVYAASSSTYGDSTEMPKVEDHIGKPLSPYAITKYVNELYANNFFELYGLEVIGLRYFNVFGPKQAPDGAYAAVIPLFTKLLMNHQSPIINGDGSNSRDFTYIENVVQMNHLALLSEQKEVIGQAFNTAVGERNDLNMLVEFLKQFLSEYDPEIANIKIEHGPNRRGDIPHSLASIKKAQELLGYKPLYTLEQGLKEAVKWYWVNLK
ncbi:MAG: SDR family oxidoreductase [Bacteroidetes bacterium]|nr:SDR family oxidoreductase [Bacteroidota bacterium]NWJ53219.1 SDR family oxidoreductase [Bacteroidota bacterium]